MSAGEQMILASLTGEPSNCCNETEAALPFRDRPPAGSFFALGKEPPGALENPASSEEAD
jgi:hypothetical protein